MMMRWRMPPTHITSLGSLRSVGLLRLIHVKSKINHGCLPTCGMTEIGDNHNLGKSRLSSRGNMATWPAWTCSDIS